jgi:hypothetical protein
MVRLEFLKICPPAGIARVRDQLPVYNGFASQKKKEGVAIK